MQQNGGKTRGEDVVLGETIPDIRKCRELAEELALPHLLGEILWQRNIRDPDSARKFLDPRLSDLPSPFLMRDMDRAVELVARALRDNLSICIHGDYDVDGISASALLSRFFRMIGRETSCYQPDRLSEGYGLQETFIRSNAPVPGKKALLITVDCGISDHETVQLARSLGFDVIVTDHHLPGSTLPPADAVLNPHRPDCSFPCPDLAGVGVAFFLAWGVRNHLVETGWIAREKAPNLKMLLDLVALGTVADVMELTGCNRILVRAGLETMNGSGATSWARCLLAQLDKPFEGPVRADDIAYVLAPRINAPGRLGDPSPAFSLLVEENPAVRRAVAGRIELMNRERRQLEADAAREVFAICAEQEKEGVCAFVVHGRFHQGIIGILASRAVDRYNRPVMVCTEDKSNPGTLRGSGRSVEGVNLFEILRECETFLLQYGGHAGAAGIALEAKNLDAFRKAFARGAARFEQVQMAPKTIIDCRVRAEEILNDSFLQHYKRLEPFGNGNPEPVFFCEAPEIVKTGTVKGHLTFTVKANGGEFRGIGFGMGDRIDMLRAANTNLAFSLRESYFRGQCRMELLTRDIIPGTK
ncbi:MAG: single-stranded-DNA-specific exonuclease RecJ [Desulfobulbaceae bacterium]